MWHRICLYLSNGLFLHIVIFFWFIIFSFGFLNVCFFLFPSLLPFNMHPSSTVSQIQGLHFGLAMDSSSSNKGDSNFADTYSSSTSVAAAAPESSTLAVKLSEDPEGQVQQDHGPGGETKSHPQDHRHSLKEPDQDSHTNTQALRRSRSGRLLRSTVQYDERDIQSRSRDNSPGPQDNYGESSRSSFPNQGNSSASPQDDLSPQRQTGGSDSEGGNRTETHRYRDESMNAMMSEEEQDEDGSGEDAEDGNNEEGSESMDTNSSKNDDGSDNLVVSMYGSPSLVKVRSMFIDKLYK